MRPRISLDQLKSAYCGLGFHQDPSDPYSFRRGSDGLCMFHHPFEGKVEASFIAEDASNWDEDVADALSSRIGKLLEDTGEADA